MGIFKLAGLGVKVKAELLSSKRFLWPRKVFKELGSKKGYASATKVESNVSGENPKVLSGRRTQVKGIILAGGKATRLYPTTKAITKQLLPVYDKPMIYYPMSVLMLAGIQEMLIISSPQELPRFQELFSDGSHLGMQIQYAAQPSPRGIPDAFIIGEKFIGEDCVSLVLGDNIFYGHGLPDLLRKAVAKVKTEGEAVVFGYYVSDPERYGIVEFDEMGSVLSIEEKPNESKSNWAITGLYFYDQKVVEIAKELESSSRGELEITDVNQVYLKRGKLSVELLGRGFAWLDTGTHESLLEAGKFIATIETRQGLKIGCIEEIAYNLGYIDRDQLVKIAKGFQNSSYGQYLLRLVKA